MAPDILDINNSLGILESQIRECFGRVAYSHKTHEKCADMAQTRLGQIKGWQIFLSALTTGSLVTNIFNIFDLAAIGKIVALVSSVALLALNTYTKDNDLGEVVQKHRDTASKLWGIRESYFSLLTDLRARHLTIEDIRARRDELQTTLNAVYEGAPPTNSAAYMAAQKALKDDEDLTFSDAEINHFLPKDLWKTPKR